MARDITLTQDEKDLARYYTGREAERQSFEALVRGRQFPKRLIVIHGEQGGIGKSRLLTMYGAICKKNGIPVALVDFAACPTPTDILAAWVDQLVRSNQGLKFPKFLATLANTGEAYGRAASKAKESGGEELWKATLIFLKARMPTVVLNLLIGNPDFPTQEIINSLANTEGLTDYCEELIREHLSNGDAELVLDPTAQLTESFRKDLSGLRRHWRVALMGDTYERMTVSGSWVGGLAKGLPEAVLLAIAGRSLPEWDIDHAWNGWKGSAVLLHLAKMEAEMESLVNSYYRFCNDGCEPAKEDVVRIVEFAAGVPLAAQVAIDVWKESHAELDLPRERGDITKRIAKPLIKVVNQTGGRTLKDALDQVAVLRRFDRETLDEMVPDGEIGNTLYEMLIRYRFIEVRKIGHQTEYAFPDLVREGIIQGLDDRPVRRRELHRNAATCYESQLKEATDQEYRRFELERLYHLIQADEGLGVELLQILAWEFSRSRDLGGMRTLLNDLDGYLGDVSEANSLWADFYKAVLADHEFQYDEAEKAYRALVDSKLTPSKLRTQALLHLCGKLATPDRLASPGGPEFVRNLLEGILETTQDDTFIASACSTLGHVCTYKGEWDKAIAYRERQMRLHVNSARPDYLSWSYMGLIDFYLTLGRWRDAFAAEREGLEKLKKLTKQPLLQRRLQGTCRWGLIWAGRYYSTEMLLRKAIVSWEEQESKNTYLCSVLTSDLALSLALQEKYVESQVLFEKALAGLAPIRGGRAEVQVASLQGFWGAALILEGRYNEAEIKLTESLETKKDKGDRLGIEELLVWLGDLHERRGQWGEAESSYSECINSDLPGRLNFQCAARAGLARLSWKAGNSDRAEGLIRHRDCEKLALECEYNDQLAGLRLMQGHMAWGGDSDDRPSDLSAVARSYKEALIYAMRFNRFLLDELLSGRANGTVHRPIITECKTRGEEGLQMLIALREWWQTGLNETGLPLQDSISAIKVAQGKPLLEAEALARRNEPGDDYPQKSVVDQINAVM